MKRSGWLRCLGWLGFTALFLATCVVMVRWTMLGRGHASVQKITGRYRPKQPLSPHAAGQLRGKSASAQTTAKGGTPVQYLPLVGMAFSHDPAVRDEFGKRLAEVRRISEALREAKDKKGIISFKKALENLGIAVPEGMTEAEAAGEFLRQAQEVSGTLARLRVALEKGPWDWGKMRGWEDEQSDRGWQLVQMLQHAASASSGFIQAHWRTGDTSSAWGDWGMLQYLAMRAGDNAGSMATSVHGSLQSMWARTVSTGISLGGWTDEQLGRIPDALASYNALDSMRRGIEVEKGFLEEVSHRPDDVRAFIAGLEGVDPQAAQGLGSVIRRLAINSASDQQIDDNLAVLAADHDYVIARFDFEKQVYTPPKEGELKPSLQLGAEGSFLTGFYFLPFMYLGGDMKEHSFSPKPASSAISHQAETDQARLAAALETQYRATGQYPDALDAAGGSFPGGMPRDVATGEPYFYERTENGGYKLWGIGIDQTNNSGDPKKDILFISPRIQTP